MDTIHLFAGGGGGLYADLILGHNPIAAVELNPFCCELLRRKRDEGWFPNLEVIETQIQEMPILGGICNVPGFDAARFKGRVDVLHAGWPCQDIAVCGKGAGIAHGERSGLWTEVVRCLREIRPPFAFLENSPQIRTRGLDIVLRDLAELGYDAKWGVIAASDVGANHRRKRWWCLCTDANQRFRHDAAQEIQPRRDAAIGICRNDSDADQGGRESERISEYKGEQGPCGNVIDGLCAGGRGQGERGSPDADQTGLAKWFAEIAGGEREEGGPDPIGVGWWDAEPPLGRMVDGMADRRNAIEALGNGQVPIQAAAAYLMLGGPLG